MGVRAKVDLYPKKELVLQPTYLPVYVVSKRALIKAMLSPHFVSRSCAVHIVIFGKSWGIRIVVYSAARHVFDIISRAKFQLARINATECTQIYSE